MPKSEPGPWDRVKLAAMMSLTLGLAPFVPEPHVVEKVRWVLQGGAGMRPLDVFDLFMHGAPWVFLAWSLVQAVRPAPEAAPSAPAE